MKKIILILILAFFQNAAKTQTTVPGGNVYGTWSLSGSPYLVQGAIQVPNDSTLTIQPGVIVNFQGHYKFIISGRLIAVGNSTDSIFFTASNTTTGWWGFRLNNIASNNDSSKFSYCSIQWGIANGNGNDGRGGAFFINNSTKLSITHNRIENCSAPNGGYGGGAIFCTLCSPIVNNNYILNNSGSNGGAIMI